MNITDGEGKTGLMVAAEEGNDAIVQLLLDKGAEVNTKNHHGKRALDLALTQSEKCNVPTEAGKKYAETVYLLLQAGAQVNKTLANIKLTIERPIPTQLLESKTDILKMLLAAGAGLRYELVTLENSLQDLTRKCIRNHLKLVHQQTSLYKTIPKLDLPHLIISYLLFYTLQKVESKLTSEESRLLLKTSQGDIDNVLSLIKAGVDVNIQDKNGITAMMIAAENGYLELLRELKQAGADVNIQNYYGDTALMCATKKEQHNCVQKLLEFGANINTKGEDGQTALMHAVVNNDDDMLHTLIKAGANLNVQDDGGCSIMVYATNGHLNSLDILLNAGSEVNVPGGGGSFSALEMAACLGKVDSLNKLIAARAELNYQDQRARKTALMLAAQLNHVECAEELIQAGADLNIQGPNGGTALTLAAQHKSFECVRILLKAGAEVDTSFLLNVTDNLLFTGNRSKDNLRAVVKLPNKNKLKLSKTLRTDY